MSFILLTSHIVCRHGAQPGDPPIDIVFQERELRISCMQPPLAVSTSGPHVVLPGTGFTIHAELVDSGRDLTPTNWQWVCTAASGSSCFTGIDVPGSSAGVLHIMPGMLLPGDHVIRVRRGPRSPSCFQTYHTNINANFGSPRLTAVMCACYSKVVVGTGVRSTEAVHRLTVLDPEKRQAPRGRLLRQCTAGHHCAYVHDAPVDPTKPLTLQVTPMTQ